MSKLGSVCSSAFLIAEHLVCISKVFNSTLKETRNQIFSKVQVANFTCSSQGVLNKLLSIVSEKLIVHFYLIRMMKVLSYSRGLSKEVSVGLFFGVFQTSSFIF